MNKKTHSHLAVAACLIELNGTVPTEIQLTPAGLFKAKDGRPEGLTGWVMNAALAQNIIALANQQTDRFAIDYEHQTLRAKENGKPAPAGGWYKNLEWREGLGLFAVDVEWTEAASLAITNKEYRYISPVLGYNEKTGEVGAVFMASLTNTPALDNMKDLCALAQSFFNTPQEHPMTEELLEMLRYVLNLPTLATIEEIIAELDKLKAMISAEPQATAAASISLLELLKVKNQKIDALSTAKPDPAKFVPVATMAELQNQIAALSMQINGDKLDNLITAALSDGRLLPAQKDWAKTMSIEALSSFLSTAQPIAALSGTQTGGKVPEGPSKGKTDDPVSIAALATAYQHEQSALGFTIDDITAIKHVTKGGQNV